MTSRYTLVRILRNRYFHKNRATIDVMIAFRRATTTIKFVFRAISVVLENRSSPDLLRSKQENDRNL